MSRVHYAVAGGFFHKILFNVFFNEALDIIWSHLFGNALCKVSEILFGTKRQVKAPVDTGNDTNVFRAGIAYGLKNLRHTAGIYGYAFILAPVVFAGVGQRTALVILLPRAGGGLVEELENYVGMVFIPLSGVLPKLDIVIIRQIERVIVKYYVFTRGGNHVDNVVRQGAVRVFIRAEPELRRYRVTYGVRAPVFKRDFKRSVNLTLTVIRPGSIRNIKSDKSYRFTRLCHKLITLRIESGIIR